MNAGGDADDGGARRSQDRSPDADDGGTRLACARLARGELTYPGRGLTRLGQWPPGYRHVHWRIPVGTGDADFERLAQAILGWQIQRRAGLRVRAERPRAAVGVRVVSGFGWGRLRIPAPCEVTWVKEPSPAGSGNGQREAGFGYGTLPGHPASGEESFLAVLDPAGTVRFDLSAFSRPANWFYWLGSPVTRGTQALVSRRYLAAARALARGSPG